MGGLRFGGPGNPRAPIAFEGGGATQPRRAGRARRTGRNWCDAAAPAAILHSPRYGYRPRSGAAPPPATAFRPRPGAAPSRRRFGPALGTTTLAGARPPLWHRAPGSGRFSRRDAATHAALGATTFALTPRSGAVPRSRGARCEKPSVLVAGGQNRRFFAVSEVRNGRYCRLFAYGLSDSANNRVFWP